MEMPVPTFTGVRVQLLIAIATKIIVQVIFLWRQLAPLGGSGFVSYLLHAASAVICEKGQLLP
jgi:hypothetical protein